MLVLVFLAYACLNAQSSDGLPTAPVPSLSMRTNATAIDLLDSAATSCPDSANCRSLYDIVWSSLATILACVWAAVHRNIPGPSQRRAPRMLEMAKVVVVTLLVPEWVLAWAVRQCLNARAVARELEEGRAEAERSWEEKGRWRTSGGAQPKPEDVDGQLDEFEDAGGIPLTDARPASVEDSDERLAQGFLLAIEDGAGRLGSKWTIRHGFFVIMGGFHLYEEGVPRHPLSSRDVIELVKTGDLVLPTEDEIELLSRGDVLSKSIAVLQTLWFIIQFITRRAQGLPISQIEVMTLAYATITVTMYAFWWYKPLNIGGPIRIVGKGLPEQPETVNKKERTKVSEIVLGTQDWNLDLRQQARVPTFYSGGQEPRAARNAFPSDIIALASAVVFGGVHLIAWHYVFPSRAEAILWHISSTAIIAVPGSLVMVALFVMCVAKTSLEKVGNFVTSLAFVLSGPLYITARVALLVLCVTSLRTLPAGVYETAQWTIRIPHIS
ncbi:hypothetical protein BV25DRAFT_1913056 [Artomyces pyxidatus]|uniref:Uncharacterized protein n=1 Tax=Artomyces pyxidatus TaxID=48021 RepID=A0ACB8TD40_9AGAM|nr:hypothetical protein BV25DRAFT_1913056 [Artomyces pyxidatus]